jgi:phosphoglycolate phosphatase
VDTAPDLIDTLNLILSREGVQPFGFDEARTMIGAGVRPLIERGLQARHADLPNKLVDRLFEDFLEHYAAHIADRSRPFPGAAETIDQLASSGFLLAICTNKLEWLSKKLLDELGLSSKFAAICGQDTFAVKKPDAEMLYQTIRAARGDRQRTVMVGDSETDIRLARNAGVPVIAVDFGYTPTPIASHGPNATIGHFSQLIPAVRALPGF